MQSRPGRIVPPLVLVLLGALGFAALLAVTQVGGPPTAWDEATHTWMVAHRVPWISSAATVLSAIFSEKLLPVVAVVLGALWLWRGRDWRPPALWVVSIGFATGLTLAVKHLVDRQRPPVADLIGTPDPSPSFPSGHTMAAFVFFFVAGYLLWRARRAWCAALGIVVGVLGTAAVAFSRVYLGYHWLTDVLASVALGLVVLGLVVWVTPMVMRLGRRHRPRHA